MRILYFLVMGLLVFNGVNAQIVNITDSNFKAKLLKSDTNTYIALNSLGKPIKIDANNDGNIQISEAQNVATLWISSSNIISLSGISSFSNLTDLDCESNKLVSLNLDGLLNLNKLRCSSNQLTSLDVKNLINLESVVCRSNQLVSLNVDGLSNLTELDCSGNKLVSLNLQGLVNLGTFYCSRNQLVSLNLEDLLNLVDLNCGANKLVSLDLSGKLKISNLICSSNQLTSLDISGLNIWYLECSNNQLSSLNLGGIPSLYGLYCNDNLLEFIDASNLTFLNGLTCNNNPNLKQISIKGSNKLNITSCNFTNNPNLVYVCTNENKISEIVDYFSKNGITGVNVNSYCSFNPGGTFYTIQGNTKLDNNNNGCDVADTNYPNLEFNILNGTVSGSLIANTTGNYTISVQEGMQTITPVLENPSYFMVSPTNTVVTFPTQTSPFTQDFCITANGIHPDLEVAVLPITRTRAGFDAKYTIIYKNKGNQTQSGSVNLTFDDAVLDLVTANPLVTNQSVNNLSWNFTDLKPFETRKIELTLNVNSPTETPAVNNNDRLSFTAVINPVNEDEQPVDNSFVLSQLVVGSYDPNDKTCLEGATIPPSALGKYVHYMIRFENKGTAEAENVVVKDMIDTSKFDISSLVVTQGSHPFVTKISETNKVEFIFENINLPFEDATNDGYVAFKIKTKPSLVVGDSFSNTASIYFDYNFPIVTNTATTSVLQSLGNQDFEFSTYFNVFPNPAKQVLNIDVKKQIELSSISIFNTLGQQVLVIPNTQLTKQVDVSNLKTGNYFIKVSSNKGSASGKFVKE
ncbi:T9SS type A sorting domain-containing protein [Flavobacterium luteum]|uniref:T9SS type A sorting domain-containing protein n=1 Tax=Flavobacterium luteum TaxID=2026654 RepID=A0A7J5AK48_9FLAO|nr:T9SS type A sorting domain-containing protein [Flavobacterium luteum]KAB1157873.1 T9SS type A sorting domain-containing protein [Flavobacterium luteum]